ncbi:DedA family protein [Immundisolibacter sp.]|uniref:DedA family protein n=1 Tax=Immundisolibacter sp. TaxID=1934948 RepID=UPI003565297D
MELLHSLLDLALHLDTHLADFTLRYGVWVYGLLAVVVFCETGLVVTPFLPGDSLLFVVGALAAGGMIDFSLAALVLFLAAVVGDSVNYAIGNYVGPRIYSRPDSRWLRQEHLRRTRAFFERHGGKTIVLARFVPIVRTFAPFVAGVGTMHYRRFIVFNVFGAAVWVGLFMTAGLVFGQLPLVKNNLTLIAVGIVVASVLPLAVQHLRARRAA